MNPRSTMRLYHRCGPAKTSTGRDEVRGGSSLQDAIVATQPAATVPDKLRDFVQRWEKPEQPFTDLGGLMTRAMPDAVESMASALEVRSDNG